MAQGKDSDMQWKGQKTSDLALTISWDVGIELDSVIVKCPLNAIRV